MGCGVSKFDKFDLDQVGPTCKFEQLPRVRNTGRRQQRSEQQVLLVSNLSFKHLLTPDNNESKLKSHQGLVKTISSPIEVDEVHVKSPDNQHLVKSVSTPIDRELDKEDHKWIEEKEDDEEKASSAREDSITASPGSPSFRDYCGHGESFGVQKRSQKKQNSQMTSRKHQMN